MNEEILGCKFINETNERWYLPKNHDIRRGRFIIHPGAEATIKLSELFNIYQPFREIKLTKKKGKKNISLKKQNGYKNQKQKDAFYCKFLNVGDNNLEVLMVGDGDTGESVSLPWGIPFEIPLPLFSKVTKFEEIQINPQIVSKMANAMTGLITIFKQNIDRKLRSDSELKRLKEVRTKELGRRIKI